MDPARELNELVARFVERMAGMARELAHTQLIDALHDTAGRGRGHGAPRAGSPRGTAAIARAPHAGPSRSTSPRRAADARRRSPDELEQLRARLYEHIVAHPGERIEQIKVALGASTRELAVPLQKLIYGDRVRTEGERRATRYFPVDLGAGALAT